MNGLHLNGQDSLVQPLLMDLYQLNMCYGYWRAGTYDDDACFDLFFRKNPFNGEFTVFAGLEDVLRLVQNFRFSPSGFIQQMHLIVISICMLIADMQFIKKLLPNAEHEFIAYLEDLPCEKLRILAIPEGTVVFPNLPLITVKGPLALCQLLETVMLNLVNYASLVATNAARFRNVCLKLIMLLAYCVANPFFCRLPAKMLNCLSLVFDVLKVQTAVSPLQSIATLAALTRRATCLLESCLG